eukprot:9621510-Alexandrium_andersonii.AAC.1
MGSSLRTRSSALTSRHTPPYGALDTAKCYDNLDPGLVLWVLERWGFDPRVLEAVRDQWTRQVRWLTLDGHVARVP